MEFVGKSYCVRSIGEVFPNQSVDQLVCFLTNPPSGEEVTNIYWLIAVFPGTKKNDRRIEPGIKSWVKPVKALKNILSNRCNMKRYLDFSLLFVRWYEIILWYYKHIDRVKGLSRGHT